MKQSCAKTETATTQVLTEIHHLHPNLQFCGEPRNAILSISGDLLRYVLSLLSDNPIHAPRISIEEWSELLSILRSHLVLPLLYWYVGRLPDEFRPPKTILDSMGTSFQWSRIRCFHMENQLREIVAAFNDEGVRILVLKGPALGRTVYPDPALRPSSDLDLLVKPGEMVQARTILEGMSYMCNAPIYEERENTFKDETFIPGKNDGNYRAIEIH